MTKVAMVVQRYGAEVVGGAEAHARQLAERFHTDLGWEVDVFSTTARDYHTWANAYPPGESWLNGVRVLRFPVRIRRTKLFSVYKRLTRAPLGWLRRHPRLTSLTISLEKLWLVLQGPYCPSLVTALATRAADYQKIIFMTYLYYPTLAGMPHAGGKALLVPTAHDEAPFWFLTVQRALRGAGAILPSTPPELALVRRQLGESTVPVELAGIGVDAAGTIPSRPPSAAVPYLLYLGRIARGKGVGDLLALFRAFRAAHGDVVHLYLAGQVDPGMDVSEGDGIYLKGRVSDEAKLALLCGATAVVNPSAYESLSLIAVEAMTLKVPVLGNAQSAVLRYYAEHVPTVWTYANADEFSRHLKAIIRTAWDGELPGRDLEAARNWALKHFSWKSVLGVFKRHVEGP